MGSHSRVEITTPSGTPSYVSRCLRKQNDHSKTSIIYLFFSIAHATLQSWFHLKCHHRTLSFHTKNSANLGRFQKKISYYVFYLKVQQFTIFLENLGSNGMLLYVPENVSLYFQSLGTTFTNLKIFALPLFFCVFVYVSRRI